MGRDGGWTLEVEPLTSFCLSVLTESVAQATLARDGHI